MSLSFLNASIAWMGLGAAAVPVVLHLLLRQKPKVVVFPAMRLLMKRQQRTTRKLRLRHLLLLALRCALLLLLGLALARPTLHSSLLSIDQEGPIRAALVVDTSLSMQYKDRGKSRLDEAKELGKRILERLPEGSEVEVLELANPAGGLVVDASAAAARLDALELSANPRVLNDAMELAQKNLLQSSKERREIYVLSDLAANSWNLSAGRGLIDDPAAEAVKVYLIDVAAKSPENVLLSEPALSQQVLAAESDLKVSVDVGNTGAAADRAVELTVDAQPRDSKPVRLPAGQSTTLAFNVAGLTEGFHQGKVSVSAGDPMEFDNVRYFTVEVRPPIKVLVAVDDPADAIHWSNALVPQAAVGRERPRYQLQRIAASKLPDVDLASFNVVALIDVGTVPQDVWIKLGQYVQSGGGLFVSLGERVDAKSYNTPAAQSVLAGKLDKEVAQPNGVAFAPDRFTHPLLAKFREWGTAELSDLPVLRYFLTAPHPAGSLVVIPYSSGDPALLERGFGAKRGLSILWTTAAHYKPSASAWTELPLGWSYVALVDQITRRLAGAGEGKFNFLAGEPIVVELDSAQPAGLATMTNPSGEFERLAVDASETTLTIPSAKELGNYRIDGADGGPAFQRAFSLNEPATESILTSIAHDQLIEWLGKDRCAIARDPDDLEAVVGEGRVGRELFPFLMLLVMVVVCAEAWIANRFYARPTGEAPF